MNLTRPTIDGSDEALVADLPIAVPEGPTHRRRPVADDRASTAARPGPARALLVGMRPRQWIKNLLVLAAPAMAGVAFQTGALARALAAMLTFTLAASGTYLINDSRDAQADRLHPNKRHRPVASGAVSTRTALVAGCSALTVGILISFLVVPWLGAIVGAYAALTFTYSFGLKRVAYVELLVVVSGFVLRAVAGAVAAGVATSTPFLIVALTGSLFVVVSKRTAEQHQLGPMRCQHRSALGVYSPRFLHLTRWAALAGTLTAYGWWALYKVGSDAGSNGWFILSILPFAALLLRYASCVSSGLGGAPEEIVLRDRLVQGLAASWILVVMVGVYGP
ncbi:MAG: decaprenyl-phosphate phosphoribosyltransferase [Acidimicrobiales bacterium]